MKEFQIDVKTPDGLMDCFVCHPEGEALPAVLFYMDVPGIREELRDMCRHIAHIAKIKSTDSLLVLPRISEPFARSGRIRAGTSSV